jgi:hypothetical protein
MSMRFRFALLLAITAVFCSCVPAQVFVVGEKTATDTLDTSITPTDVPLPNDGLDERGRRDLIRGLEAEQGFAHRALPLGGQLTLNANGRLVETPEQYRQLVYKKGEAVVPGDRILVTRIAFERDKLVVDLNGGPYLKHRILRHIEINGVALAPSYDDVPTGSRVNLLFEGGIPELSPPEVKALLAPLLDFGVKRSEEAYADTLPTPIRNAIAKHEILVGMNHKMVLAAAGQPESKLRERAGANEEGKAYEEWIYGHMPQTVRFVRFEGDHVTQVKIAALGKPIELHATNELGDNAPADPVHEVANGDVHDDLKKAPPTLRRAGEPIPQNGSGAVRMPPTPKDDTTAKHTSVGGVEGAPGPGTAATPPQ